MFLPAAGYRKGSDVNDVGYNASYWSATPDPDLVDCAQDFYFHSGGSEMYIDYRYYGSSVRLVRSLQ